MSLDQVFADLLKDKVGVWDFEQMEKRMAAFEERLTALEDEPSYDKEFYNAQDYATLLHVEPATITQNYFRTNKINAKKENGCKCWVTTADEYRRVEHIVRTRGSWALN